MHGTRHRTSAPSEPAFSGPIRIGDRRFRKTSTEFGRRIAGLPKLLDLPGEEHFLVPRSRVIAHYPGIAAMSQLSADELADLRGFVELLEATKGVPASAHGLTGSLALRSRLPASDYDWVLYDTDPSTVRGLIERLADIRPVRPFSKEFLERKYLSVSGLSARELAQLFGRRWTYFYWGQRLLSLSFVSTSDCCDELLNLREYTRRAVVRGVVRGAGGSHFMPRRFEILADQRSHRILTWLFLYKGALEEGDTVEVIGHWASSGGEKFLVIGRPGEHMRLLRRADGADLD